MAVVQANKRGHHSEFALTKEEIADLIAFTTNKRTRAMVILASLGVPVRGIVAFRGNSDINVYTNTLDIAGITTEPIRLSTGEFNLLIGFGDGFRVTGVTVWRRIKHAIQDAGRDGVITFDPDHVPFPAALSYEPPEQRLTSQQMIRWCLGRVHALQQALPGQDHGTAEACPHRDCDKIRKWLRKK